MRGIYYGVVTMERDGGDVICLSHEFGSGVCDSEADFLAKLRAKIAGNHPGAVEGNTAVYRIDDDVILARAREVADAKGGDGGHVELPGHGYEMGGEGGV